MTEAMQGLLAEAKKNKYSTIKDNLSEEGKVYLNTFQDKNMKR